MALTRVQKRLYDEAREIAKEVMLDIWQIEAWPSAVRIDILRVAIHRMVIAEVVVQYTLLDEILADLICRYYFKEKHTHFGKLWKTKRFKTFVQYVLDEMYLLKKLEVVNQIESVPSDVRKTVQKVNAVRNSLAHSFFPENRKEYSKKKKVLYGGKDLMSRDGLLTFKRDAYNAWAKLAARIDGISLDKLALMDEHGVIGASSSAGTGTR
jgi:hypothetical protein